MTTHTGKKRLTLAADAEQLFRIVQSIPSPKAEPFKQWLAHVGLTSDSEAGVARKAAEKELGHSVVSDSNFLDKNPDSILIGGVDEE